MFYLYLRHFLEVRNVSNYNSKIINLDNYMNSQSKQKERICHACEAGCCKLILVEVKISDC